MVQTPSHEKLVFRELEKTRQLIVNGTGLEITWAYDDLVFVEHNAFIIRFDDNDTHAIHCYFNVDCQAEKAEQLFNALLNAAPETGMSISNAGLYELCDGKSEEEIDIKFIEKKV
jgi:hypothetical protein